MPQRLKQRAKYYRDKAKELRLMIPDMSDEPSRLVLRRLANTYDAMAAKTEQRAEAAQSTTPQSNPSKDRPANGHKKGNRRPEH